MKAVGVLVVVAVIAACAYATFFARSGTSVANGQPTATNDPSGLYANSFATDAQGWPNDPPRCFLGAGGYHVSDRACFAPIGDESDVDVSVQLKQISGATTGRSGISMRADASGDGRYDIGLGVGGQWLANRCAIPTTTGKIACTTIASGTNTSIHLGMGASNLLRVRATGATMQIFVNGTSVGYFTDPTYQLGHVGLWTSADVEAVFSDFTVRVS